DARCLARRAAILRRGREPREFRKQTGLADAGLARDEDDLGVTKTRGLVCEVEPRQLHPPPDQGRRDVDRRTHVGALAGERVHEDRPFLALELDRPYLAERELTVRETERGLRHVGLART